MNRPSHLEILEYALEGVRTQIGTSLPETDDDFEWLDCAEKHATWLDKAIARRKEVDARARARNTIALAKDLAERRPA